VKTGSDATRYQVSRTTWYTGINYLDSLAPPGSFGSYAQNHRIKWPEFRTWQINDTTLVAIKLEDDGDLHLRLRSSTGKTMIAEIPRPGCVSSSSLWKAGITAARNDLHQAPLTGVSHLPSAGPPPAAFSGANPPAELPRWVRS
jgi:hypothetical protein